MITRYFSAIGTGGLMTFSLLYVMQMLIGIQPGVVTDPGPRFPVDWLILKEEKKPPPPPQPTFDRESMTEAPLPPSRVMEGMTQLPVTRGLPVPPTVPGAPVPKGMPMVDGPLVSLVRVEPVYPVNAERRGLEGYVIVQFDVLADGYVANVSIVESSNRMFENASIRAVQRFRFKPRVVDGIPLVSTGIQNLFRFEMDAAKTD